MYYAIILLLMLVLPALSIAAEMAIYTGTPFLALLGKWFVFWAMGIRLLLAGIKQIAQPAFTASLLGIKNTESYILVRELGFANFSMGTLATLSLWLPLWMIPAALLGTIFYALAGINHLLHPHRNRQENVAMITDLYAAGVLILVCINAMR